jgi:hypothetical protein
LRGILREAESLAGAADLVADLSVNTGLAVTDLRAALGVIEAEAASAQLVVGPLQVDEGGGPARVREALRALEREANEARLVAGPLIVETEEAQQHVRLAILEIEREAQQAQFHMEPLEPKVETRQFTLGVNTIISESRRLQQQASAIWRTTGEEIVEPISQAFDELVFHSIVTEGVNLIISHFKRMRREAVPPAYELGQELAKVAIMAMEQGAKPFEAATNKIGKAAQDAADKVKSAMEATRQAIIAAMPAPIQMAIYVAELNEMYRQGKTDTDQYVTGQKALETAAYATSAALVAWLDATRAARAEAGTMQVAIEYLSKEFELSSSVVRELQSQCARFLDAGQTIKQWTLQVLSGIQQQYTGYMLLNSAMALVRLSFVEAATYAAKALAATALFEGLKTAIESAIPEKEVAKGADVLQRLADELRAIDALEKARGERYDELTAKARAYERALEDLARAGASAAVIQEVAGKLTEIELQIQARDVPAAAQGGIVPARPGGRLVRVAEAGEDEAIIPLSRLGRMSGGLILQGPLVQITGNQISRRDDVEWVGEELVTYLRKRRIIP